MHPRQPCYLQCGGWTAKALGHGSIALAHSKLLNPAPDGTQQRIRRWRVQPGCVKTHIGQVALFLTWGARMDQGRITQYSSG